MKTTLKTGEDIVKLPSQLVKALLLRKKTPENSERNVVLIMCKCHHKNCVYYQVRHLIFLSLNLLAHKFELIIDIFWQSHGTFEGLNDIMYMKEPRKL